MKVMNLQLYESFTFWNKLQEKMNFFHDILIYWDATVYAATNSVSLWDYGINKFNCITVSVQFML